MSDLDELYYSLRYCDECGGGQKNCEHYFAGFANGQKFAEACIINKLKDQFAFAMECETKEGLQVEQNSIYWSERWQLTFNELIDIIKGETE